MKPAQETFRANEVSFVKVQIMFKREKMYHDNVHLHPQLLSLPTPKGGPFQWRISETSPGDFQSK